MDVIAVLAIPCPDDPDLETRACDPLTPSLHLDRIGVDIGDLCGDRL